MGGGDWGACAVRRFKEGLAKKRGVMFWGEIDTLMHITDSLLIYQIFLSPQVKGSAVISNKHDIYELSHELPNYLRLRILEKIRKI